jgi:Family of unknown function (DUF5691)
MTGWDELVSVALLGTDRRPPAVEGLPEAVRAQLDTSAGPPRLLLDAAALSAAYRRAGRTPLRGPEPLPAATTDNRPVPRQAAVRRLASMLAGAHGTVLPEWLRVLHERGWRVPPEFLPALADLTRGRTELRAAVRAAAGPRARWLAGLNPDWSFLDEGVAEGNDVWAHGSPAQRRQWLLETRRADPDAARNALAATWASEPATIRADLLAVLADGLASADEEFCEGALDDRAAEVRRVAAGLLGALPGSAYGKRMAGRVRACLTVRRLPLRREVLVVTLPDECDDGMRRDGISPRPPQGVGERAWWFSQLVAAAPLPASPDDYLGLEVEGCDPELLHAALAAAVVRERSADWARALLRTDPAAGHRTSELVAVLPRGDWAATVSGLRTVVDPAEVVGGLPQPWPPNLAMMLLDVLAAAAPDRSWARLASITARSVPPEVLAADHPLIRRPDDQDDTEDTWRRRLAETLVFRRDMYEELS